jgi:membrane protein
MNIPERSVKSYAIASGRFLYRLVYEYFSDDCLVRAASLSFTTLLSLIPLLVVSFSIYSGFGGFEEYMVEVRRKLFEFANPGTIEQMDDFWNSLMLSREKAAALGVIGLVALMIPAWALFNSVEVSFNKVWNVSRSRTFREKIGYYTIYLVWIPLLIALSIYLTDQLRDFFEIGTDADSSSIFQRFWTFSLPFLLTWIAFFLAYKVIPHRAVPWLAALIGALVGGLLWELAKVGYDYYIGQVSSFQQIYGALGAIPLFLLWLYYTWAIVLLGAEISYIVAHPTAWKSRQENIQRYGLYFAIRFLKSAAERFETNKPPLRLQDLSKKANADEDTALEILQCLVDAGLLLRSADRRKGYSLGRSAGRINLQDISEALQGNIYSVPDGAKEQKVNEVLANIREEHQKLLSQIRISQLVEVQEEATQEKTEPGLAEDSATAAEPV